MILLAVVTPTPNKQAPRLSSEPARRALRRWLAPPSQAEVGGDSDDDDGTADASGFTVVRGRIGRGASAHNQSASASDSTMRDPLDPLVSLSLRAPGNGTDGDGRIVCGVVGGGGGRDDDSAGAGGAGGEGGEEAPATGAAAQRRRRQTPGELVRSCGAVVGYHTCGASEAAIDLAVSHRKPFVIVPCCLHAVGDRPCATAAEVRRRLMAKHPLIREHKLGLAAEEGDAADADYALFVRSW